MSKTIFCQAQGQLLHDWTDWELAEGVFSPRFGKNAGVKFVRQVRARMCNHCKQIDWRVV